MGGLPDYSGKGQAPFIRVSSSVCEAKKRCAPLTFVFKFWGDEASC